MTTTGFLVANLPASEDLNAALHIVRLCVKFQAQMNGRKPDAITRYLASLVRGLPKPVSFNALLEKLEAETAKHDVVAGACVCSEINRVHQLAAFFHPKRGTIDVPFGTLRNKFTKAKFMLKPMS